MQEFRCCSGDRFRWFCWDCRCSCWEAHCKLDRLRYRTRYRYIPSLAREAQDLTYQEGDVYHLCVLGLMTHSSPSNLQFVQGVPASTTSHRTFRVRQRTQALLARFLILRFASPAVERSALAAGESVCVSEDIAIGLGFLDFTSFPSTILSG